MNSSNDAHFDPQAQLLELAEQEAVAYVQSLVAHHAGAADAAYAGEVVTAGAQSLPVTLKHAQAGSPMAQLVYGVAKLEGAHTGPSVSEALFWLLRACHQGNAKAGLVLSHAFIQGKATPRNPSRALMYAEMAAELGSADGLYLLAHLLLGHAGIAEDQDRAVALLRTAASAGHAPSIRLLEENGL